MIPHFFLGFALSYFIVKGSTESVYALALASALWLCTMIIPRLLPADKPGPVEAEMQKLRSRIDELDKTVTQNAEYSAREFGTLKNVLQMKQLGR